MQKVVITTGWSYRVLLKCILTCYWPRRPPITNKVTFAQGAPMGFIKSLDSTCNQHGVATPVRPTTLWKEQFPAIKRILG